LLFLLSISIFSLIIMPFGEQDAEARAAAHGARSRPGLAASFRIKRKHREAWPLSAAGFC
jgi:hypothetical protein